MKSDPGDSRYSTDRRYSELIQSSLDMIEKNLGDISIDDLAGSAFFSRYHFQRLFHAIVGDPVMEYVKKRRLESAGKELRDTNITILDIALKYGYNSHEGFTRAFKGFYGITPNEFRKTFEASSVNMRELMKPKMCRILNVVDYNVKVAEYSIEEGMLMDTKKVIMGENGLNEFLKIFSGFADDAKALSAKTDGIVESSSNGKGVLVMSREMLSLSQRIHISCEEIEKFLASDSGSAFDSYDMMFKIIKCVDDVAFQMNLLEFLGIIEIERTGNAVLYREVIAGLRALSGKINVDKEKMIGIINDMIALISADIQSEAINRYESAAECIEESEAEGFALYDDIKAATESAKHFKTYLALSEMISTNSKSMNELSAKMRLCAANAKESSSITEFIASLENGIKNVIHELEDMAFFTNVVAFAATVESERIGESEHIRSLSHRIRDHAGNLQNRAKVCANEWNEVKKILAVFEQKPPSDKAQNILIKTIDDISFQDMIMSYHLIVEAARYGDTVIEGISQRISDNCTFIKRAVKNADKFNGGHVTSELKEKIMTYVTEMESNTKNLTETAVAAGDKGAPFRFIAASYSGFEKRIHEFADKL